VNGIDLLLILAGLTIILAVYLYVEWERRTEYRKLERRVQVNLQRATRGRA